MRVSAGLLVATVLCTAVSGCGTTVPVQSRAAGPVASVGSDQGLAGLAPVSSGIAAGGSGSATPLPAGVTSPGAAPKGTSTGRSAGSGPTLPTPRTAVGGAAEHSPIKIGIIYVNNDAASSAGISNGNTFTPRKAFEAIVAAYNARGGLAGRHIIPVFVELKSSSTSLKGDIEAGCVTFTQDEHVAAVWGSTGVYSEAFSACLAKARTPMVTGDYALGDAQALQRAPYVVAAATLTTDDRVRLLLERLFSAGLLTGKDRLGVVVEGCPFDQRAYVNAVEPTAKRLGLTIGQSVTARCFEAIGDLGGQASDMQSAVLKFQTNGVNKVLFVSGSVEANLMLYFATAAESQKYHPGYALTSGAAPAAQEANTPKAQLANAVGLGWLPSIDINHASPLLPAARQCLADLKRAGGITPQSAVDRSYAFSACDAAGLYGAALGASHGQADAASVLAALSTLRTSYQAASPFGERTDFSRGRRTGPAQGHVFAWSTSCGCFGYTGVPVGLA